MTIEINGATFISECKICAEQIMWPHRARCRDSESWRSHRKRRELAITKTDTLPISRNHRLRRQERTAPAGTTNQEENSMTLNGEGKGKR
jgi:hypothetical protein